MLDNYFRIAIAVLLRRKFLTLVNLFGIVLTLTVLVVAAAILESMVHPAGAESGQERVLVMDMACMKGKSSSGCAQPGRQIFTQFVQPLKTPAKVSYATVPAEGVSYVGGRRVELQLRRTDAAYWQILSFSFLEGRALSADDVAAGRRVAVINAATAETFFPGASPLGKRIPIEAQTFEVVGVVANEPQTSEVAYADVWVPYTTTEVPNYEEQWGGGLIFLQAKDPDALPEVQAELEQRLKNFVYTPDPERFDTLTAPARTGLQRTANRLMGDRLFEGADNTSRFVAVALLLVALFMLLPAVNIANINIGRILERAAEIGLRKATGTSVRTLIGQFVFENLVLTFIGGVVSFAMAWLILHVLNSGWFTYGALTLNYRVFLAGVALVLVFGFVSGIYPAWRMARLEPAAALRGFRNV